MSRSKGVHGTPVNFVGPAGAFVGSREGFTPGVASGLDGTTTLRQYKGDQSQQLNPRSGTPLQDRAGNPDEFMRTASSGRYGVSPGAGGVEMNSAVANGNGVLFDGVSEIRDYLPRPTAALDSPVPDGKQMPNTNSSDTLNALRNGSGKDYSGSKEIPDQIVSVGGVMSRD